MGFGQKTGTRGQGQDISRTCPGLVQLSPLKEEHVKDCRSKNKPWSCPSWTEDEADIAAEMINLLSDYCVKVGVQVILIEA